MDAYQPPTLHDAIRTHDLDVVHTFLLSNPEFDLNQPRPEFYNLTPLIFAANLGNALLVEKLIEFGADVNFKLNVMPEYIEHVIPWGMDNRMAWQCIRRFNAHMQARCFAGWTALHSCCLWGHLECLRTLLKYGASANEAVETGWAPIHSSCCEGETEILRLLISAGADPNHLTERGETPLHQACASGRMECISVLAEHGADLNAIGHDGFTPLHVASVNNNLNCVQLLKTLGGNLHMVDKWGNKALTLAQAFEATEVAEFIADFSDDEDGDESFSESTSSSSTTRPYHERSFTPGLFKVIKNTIVREDEDPHSLPLRNVDVFERVQILEVKTVEDRVRGLLQEGGWMTLRNNSRRKIYVEEITESEAEHLHLELVLQRN